MGPSWSRVTWGNMIVGGTSHGCVRMCNAANIELHNLMPNPAGNKIIISNGGSQLRRVFLGVFVGTQIAGEICFWTGPHVLSSLGPILWVSGIVLLFPCGLLGTAVVEKLLWSSSLTLLQMAVLEILLAIAINLAAWLLCMKAYRVLRRQRAAPSPPHSTRPSPHAKR